MIFTTYIFDINLDFIKNENSTFNQISKILLFFRILITQAAFLEMAREFLRSLLHL